MEITTVTEYRRRDYETDIIIPVWGREELAWKCITSIQKNTFPARYQITLIDNGCHKQVFDHWIRGKFSDLNIIHLPFNHGFIRAANLGLATSLLTNSKYVLLLNSDTQIPEGDKTWLERLTAPMAEDSTIGAVGAVSDRVYGHQRRAEPLKLPVYHYDVTLIGFCLLLRKEAVAKVGLLDEQFEPGNFEDFDYSIRLKRAGYKLAIAESVFIAHEMHASFKELNRAENYKALIDRNKQKLLDKWGEAELRGVGL